MSASTSRWSRLASVANVLVAQFNVVLVTAGSFLVTPAMLRGLGDDRYGGWLLINSFISYMRFLDLGMSSGTLKYAAGARERGDMKDMRAVLDSTAAVFSIVGTVSVLATTVLAFVLPRVYPVTSDAGTPILILGIAFAVDLYSRVFAATLRAESLFYVYDGVEIVTYSVFKLGLLLYFSHDGGLTYKLLAWLTLGETLVRNGFVVVAAFVASPPTRAINPFRPQLAMVKKLTAMGVAVTTMQLADIVRFQLDAAVIGFFKPDNPTDISIFAVGGRLPSIAGYAIGIIGAVLIPRFSGLSETNDHEGIRSLLRKGSLVIGLVSPFVFINIGVFGPNFLSLWLHKPWVHESGHVLLLLIPGYFVSILTNPANSFLLGRGRLRSLTILTVLEALANGMLSVALVGPFGIYGVAIGTMIPMVIVRGIFFPMLLQTEGPITFREYYGMYLRPLSISLIYLVLVAGFAFIPLDSFVRFFLLAGASAVIYGLILLALVPEARTGFVRLTQRIPFLRRGRGVGA